MARPMPNVEQLPYALYRAEQVRELDRLTIEEYGIPGRTLMERAGAAAFRLLRERWPDARQISVLCGIGNNGGDGYVVARLAREAGLTVRLFQLGDPARLRGDAHAVAEAYRAAGGEVEPFRGLPPRLDLVVDALFGTGLEREIAGEWRAAVEAVNAHTAPALAIDVPSGLHSDSGRVLGVAVEAAATISFIGLKRGMFTGDGPAVCGEIRLDTLEVPAQVYAWEILSARRLDWGRASEQLAPRRRTAHKGEFGHLLVIGGDRGMPGAARLAAEAGARSGAGLVSVATHPEHAPFLNGGRPELMVRGVAGPAGLAPLLQRATVVAVGPGLGLGEWGRGLWQELLGCGRPLVVDADALNLLAEDPVRREDWVLTPHPGEAARLLRSSTAEIHADRFAALEGLQRRYGGVVVLKGAGTLIHDGTQRPPAVCSEGNPGMASGGMGDLLTGIIGGLIAQGHLPADAAEIGVALHAAAGDRAARAGERGMLAGDLLPELRGLVNPGEAIC